MKNILIVLLLVVIATAGTVFLAVDSVPMGPRHDTPYAQVWVYRIGGLWVSGGKAPVVQCDGKDVAKMGSGEYFRLRLAPGLHHLSFKDGQHILELEVESGFEYFLSVAMAEAKTPYWMFDRRGRVGGIEDLDRVKPLKPGKVIDPTIVDVPTLLPAP